MEFSTGTVNTRQFGGEPITDMTPVLQTGYIFARLYCSPVVVLG
jgi:hypothetical protein